MNNGTIHYTIVIIEYIEASERILSRKNEIPMNINNMYKVHL